MSCCQAGVPVGLAMRGLGLLGTVAEEDIGCQVAADFRGCAGEPDDCLPGVVDYLEDAGEGEDVVRVVVGALSLSLEFVEGVGEFFDDSGEGIHVSGVLESASGGSMFESAVGAVPGGVVVVIFESANQGVGIGVCESGGTWRSTLC